MKACDNKIAFFIHIISNANRVTNRFLEWPAQMDSFGTFVNILLFAEQLRDLS